MKATALILTLLVGHGCSGVPLRDLELESMTCDPSESEDCRRLKRKFEKLAEKEQMKCPQGYILIVDRDRAQCVSRTGYEVFTSPFGG